MRIINTAILALAVTTPAYAQGIVITMTESGTGQPVTNRVQMDQTHVRAESREGNDQTAFIYDGPAQVVRVVNITKKTYMEMSKAQMQQMNAQMSGVMAAMQGQLASLPPAQRAQIEQMMAARGGGPGAAAPPKTEYRRTGTDKVGQWACTKYDGFQGGQKVAEICAADLGGLGVTAADFEVMRQLADFVKALAPQAADQLVMNGTVESEGFAGVPVRRTAFQNGRAGRTTELTELRREAVPASTFAVPAEFRREAMPGGR